MSTAIQLDPAEVVALCNCLDFVQSSQFQPRLSSDLHAAMIMVSVKQELPIRGSDLFIAFRLGLIYWLKAMQLLVHKFPSAMSQRNANDMMILHGVGLKAGIIA